MPGSSSIVQESANLKSPPQSPRPLTTDSPPTSPTEGANIRPRWTHNPVVLAALACSNMGSCEDVKRIYHECIESNSDSVVCEAAEKYYRMCQLNPSNEKFVLDYNPMAE